MRHNVTAVILAAGLGTRMRSERAKVLHKAGGDTLLNHVIRAASTAVAAGQTVVVVGHQADRVRESVRNSEIRFAIQAEQRGTGHALLCARESIPMREGLLLILNGDGPLVRGETLQRLLASAQEAPGGSLITTQIDDPTGYGRIVRDADGTIAAIVEQKSATAEQLAIREVNPGAYCFQAEPFWSLIDKITPNNSAGEYYLTDMVGLLISAGYPVSPYFVEDATELLGINTRMELSVADRILRDRKKAELMLSGVTMEFPETITIDTDVAVGQDTLLESGVQLRGTTRIGRDCHISAGSILKDCVVGDGVTVLPYVVAEQSSFGAGSHVGPFARFRMSADVGEGAHVGNFVELKKTRLGNGAKANHLAYLGDATVGAGSNIGAGTITCNYDGRSKHATTIGENSFVGSNSTLVAPITVGNGAYVAAGSTITKDIADDSLAIGRSQQVEKPGWAKARREKQAKT